jgi:RimJ/RimL family protein N-acetyltransferase
MVEGVHPSFPAPERLEGGRVVVRPYVDADAPALYGAIRESIEHLRPWMAWAEQYRSVDDALAYIRQSAMTVQLGTDFPLGIFARADGQFLGGTGLHVSEPRLPSFEIGYWIRQSAEGRGYVSEAVRLLTGYAFESMGAARVVIQCNAGNERSKHVAERLGFTYEGRLRNAERDTTDRLADRLIFAMIPAEYERIRRSRRE